MPYYSEEMERMKAVEEKLFSTSFIAPCVGNRKVSVRINGLVHTFCIDAPFLGWGVFQPVSVSNAKFVGKATPQQITSYLDLFPFCRYIVVEKVDKGTCRAVYDTVQGYVQNKQNRMSPTPSMFISLCPAEIQLFERVIVRSISSSLHVFDHLDYQQNPEIPHYLDESFLQKVPVETLRFSGLRPSDKIAYGLALKLISEKEKQTAQGRLENALAHGGGSLKSYTERDTSYTVTWSVDSVEYVTAIEKADFQVVSSGICLSGEDKKFDLTSLVSVMREKNREDVW